MSPKTYSMGSKIKESGRIIVKLLYTSILSMLNTLNSVVKNVMETH